jgi:hypothetical protein
MSFLNVAQTKNPPIFLGGFWIPMIALYLARPGLRRHVCRMMMVVAMDRKNH